MPNLFISYDLIAPEQNYEAVQRAIKSLGRWHKFQYSLFYVHTELGSAEAFAAVHSAMDANDRLLVIDAIGGIVTNWDQPPVDAINAIWHQP